LALLIATALQRRCFQPSPAAAALLNLNSCGRWLMAAVGATWIAMSLSAAVWVHRLPAAERDVLRTTITGAVFVGFVGGVAIAVLGLRRKSSALLLSLFLLAFLVELAGVAVLPNLDPFFSARVHGNFLSHSRYPDRLFTYHLTRSWQYGLSFYLQREVPEWLPSDARAALVLTTPQGLEEIRKLGRVQGILEETYKGLAYVPIFPAPR